MRLKRVLIIRPKCEVCGLSIITPGKTVNGHLIHDYLCKSILREAMQAANEKLVGDSVIEEAQALYKLRYRTKR